MRLMPKDKVGKIEYCRAHLAKWQENAAEMGVPEELMQQFTEVFAATDAAYKSQRELMQAAQAATQRLDQSLKKMQMLATIITTRVRNEAKTTGNKIVYTAAQIPAPKKASKIDPPGVPTDFSFEIDSIGVIRLKWKCKNPPGSQATMYRIFRTIDGDRRELGKVGRKQFADTTVKAGTKQITYEVQSFRSTGTGDVGYFSINLGISDNLPVVMLTQNKEWNVLAA